MPGYPSFNEAFFAMQPNLPAITKDSVAEIPNRAPTHYANLKTITDAIRPFLTEYGFIWLTRPTLDEGKPVLVYELTHLSHTAENPQQRTGTYPIFGDNKPQALGAAITYARRYALCAVLGLTPDNEEDAEGKPVAAARRMNRKPTGQNVATDADEVPGVPLPGEPADRITQPQQRAIFGLLRKLQVSDADRFPTVNPVLVAAGFKPVTSFTELTIPMGKAIYDALDKQVKLRTSGSETPDGE